MIFTFYSYKGGVGRTMALANVAELLLRAGLRVLMIDWDIEAPGLERFFFPSDQLEKVLSQPGLMDMLLAYKEQMASSEDIIDNDGSLLLPHPKQFLQHIPSSPSKGKLMLLTAGKRSRIYFAQYARTILTFDWQDFYQHWEGERYIEWLRQKFTELADVVLIDSRTGVTEIGGICTYQLADIVVMFCAPNSQSMTGTYQMAHNFKNPELTSLRMGRALEILIVPARVDKLDSSLVDEFQREFMSLFKNLVPLQLGHDARELWKLHIPYIPKYSFKEVVAVREEGLASAEEMIAAFTNLTQALVTLASPQPAR